jgi:hypothetical protein
MVSISTQAATGEQHPELAGPPAVAARAVGEEPELLFLDAVFHLAARAAELVAELLRVAFEAGDHKARVASLFFPTRLWR